MIITTASKLTRNSIVLMMVLAMLSEPNRLLDWALLAFSVRPVLACSAASALTDGATGDNATVPIAKTGKNAIRAYFSLFIVFCFLLSRTYLIQSLP